MTVARAAERLRIVGIGGGTGLSALLTGLDLHARHSREARGVEITAIVSVADDGGSTGVLRAGLGIPAVGDIRNCLVALSRGGPQWSDLFQYRFSRGDGLAGHALGNIIVAALVQRSGSLVGAIEELSRILRLRGRILPVTEEDVSLGATLDDGEEVLGESRIPHPGRRIQKLWLTPSDARPAPGVLDAIEAADAIVLGPGSLYTSLLPNLLVRDVAAAIRSCQALRIFVCNIMTQPGETDGFDATDHVAILQEYLGRGAIDTVIVNDGGLDLEIAGRYAENGAAPVVYRRERGLLGAFPIVADLLDRGNLLGRHDPRRLAEVVVSTARCLVRRQPAPLVFSAPSQGPVPVCIEPDVTVPFTLEGPISHPQTPRQPAPGHVYSGRAIAGGPPSGTAGVP